MRLDRHAWMTLAALVPAFVASPALAQANRAPADVNVVNTPNVSIANTPTVSIGNTPTLAGIAGTVKTATVLPAQSFNGSVGGSGYRTLGPGTSGTLGVTSITLSNLGTTTSAVFVFAPVFGAGSACGSADVIGGASPRFHVFVPPPQTVHLPYPSPVVFGSGGRSCVGFSGGDGLDITVNGFVN